MHLSMEHFYSRTVDWKISSTLRTCYNRGDHKIVLDPAIIKTRKKSPEGKK